MNAHTHSHRRLAIAVLAVLTILVTASALAWFTLYDNYHAVIPGELYRSGQMGTNRPSSTPSPIDWQQW